METCAKTWREWIVIPAYEVGVPEKKRFSWRNVSIRALPGAVYPYPVIESIAEGRTDKTYEAAWMENEYIKVMILPEL